MLLIVNEYIKPLFQFTQPYFLFHRNQRGRVMNYLYQVLNKILPHPLYGGQP